MNRCEISSVALGAPLVVAVEMDVVSTEEIGDRLRRRLSDDTMTVSLDGNALRDALNMLGDTCAQQVHRCMNHQRGIGRFMAT